MLCVCVCVCMCVCVCVCFKLLNYILKYVKIHLKEGSAEDFLKCILLFVIVVVVFNCLKGLDTLCRIPTTFYNFCDFLSAFMNSF